MTFKGDLYPFQKEAVDRMIERGSLLLAHEMGLGKTVSSIAAIERLIDDHKVKCALVVVPASVKWQWARQIQAFSDGALVKVIEGTKAARMLQYRSIKRGDVEYAICNYEQVVNDWEVLRLLNFDAIIVDEATAIKNPGAKRTRHLRRLSAPYKFGLTGQPIENRPEELYNIMRWIDEEVLGRPDIFERTFIVRNDFGGVKYYKNLGMMRGLISEAMDRRTHAEVADQLPKVVEEQYVIDFDPAGARLYQRIADELLDAIRNGGPRFNNFDVFNHYAGVQDNMAAMGEIMPRLMALRMLCDHPRLLQISAKQFSNPDSKSGSAYAAELKDRQLLDTKAAPKLAVTLEVFQEIFDASPDNKIVLFSFFKPVLRLIAEKLKVGYATFTGDLNARERDAAMQRFANDKSCRVLLSSDAGGIGVDMPAANYLISYDLPWSAGKYKQRLARIQRISSKWESVTLLSMVMKDSIEEWIYELLESKSQVASAWIDGKGVDRHGQLQVTAGSLGTFLEEH